jgi:hypothetical protein
MFDIRCFRNHTMALEASLLENKSVVVRCFSAEKGNSAPSEMMVGICLFARGELNVDLRVSKWNTWKDEDGQLVPDAEGLNHERVFASWNEAVDFVTSQAARSGMISNAEWVRLHS